MTEQRVSSPIARAMSYALDKLRGRIRRPARVEAEPSSERASKRSCPHAESREGENR